MIALEQTAGGVVIAVRVRAGARRTGVAGEHDGALRVDVSAAPEKGKANRAVIGVLADALHVSKSSIELLAGATSSQKRFLIAGMNSAEAAARLNGAITEQ